MLKELFPSTLPSGERGHLKFALLMAAAVVLAGYHTSWKVEPLILLALPSAGLGMAVHRTVKLLRIGSDLAFHQIKELLRRRLR